MINKEGVFLALVALLAALLAQRYLNVLLAVPFWLILATVVYLFRDPKRETPSSPLAIIAPADGKIVSVETAEDPYVKRPAIKFTIKMNPFGVYTTRSPTEGKIMQSWFKNPEPGVGHDHDLGIWIQTDEQDDVVLVMQQHSFLNSPKCFIHSGERIGQGRPCGYIRFGSDLELYIPENSKVDVEPGSKIQAGTSVLAHLRHSPDTINETLISA